MSLLNNVQRQILQAVGQFPDTGVDWRQRRWPWQTIRFLERHGLVQRGHLYRVECWYAAPGVEKSENWYAHRFVIRVTDKGRDTLRLGR